MTHTHVGWKSNVAYMPTTKLRRHREEKAGKTHALNAVGHGEHGYRRGRYLSLCGESVWLDDKDQFGFPREGGPRNVFVCGTRSVTCKRCLRLMVRAEKVEPKNHWTEEEADVELPRCIHGVPRNVFCGKCEA